MIVIYRGKTIEGWFNLSLSRLKSPVGSVHVSASGVDLISSVRYGWLLCIIYLPQILNYFNVHSLCREWYSYHFPELVKLVPDNYMYARTAKLIGSRKEFTEDKLEKLEAIVMDSTKVEAIYEAAKVSMGEGGRRWSGLWGRL